MGGGVRAFLGLVALACLPGIVRCQEYTLQLPRGEALPRAEWSQSYLGGWEVSVAFDPILCQVHCAYRQKHPGLTSILLPPVTTIRIYTDSVTQPVDLIVDPASQRLPRASSLAIATRAQAAAMGKHGGPTAPVETGESPQPRPDVHSRPQPDCLLPALSIPVSLRI